MDNTFRPSTFGINFDLESGKLRKFDHYSITVMILWPKPMAWKKTRSNPCWTHYRPRIFVPHGDLDPMIEQTIHPADRYGQLLLPCCITPKMARFYRINRAKLYWFATIPENIRNVVSKFPEKRQWHLLSFLARCGSAALDLTLSNPALAYMLASNWVFHQPAVKRPLRSARSLLAPHKKQRDILAWLHFPGTEAARRILAKIVHQALDISRLLYLRQAMDDADICKALSHLPRLNAGVLRITTDRELFPFATHLLLRELSQLKREDEWPATSMLLNDCVSMHRSLYPEKKCPRWAALPD